MALDEHDPGRSEIERRLGKNLLSRLVAKFEEERENNKWFEESTTACPGCNIRVEKSYGCNHVRSVLLNLVFSSRFERLISDDVPQMRPAFLLSLWS